MTANLIFFPIVPERKPRTECGCQPVAFISSFVVAPPGRFSRSSTASVLLPWRAPAAFSGTLARLAPLAPFFTGAVFLPDLPLDGATRGFRGATLAFVVGFGSCTAPLAAWVVCSSVVSVVIVVSPLRLITAVTTWIAPVRRRKQVNSVVNRERRWKGDGLQMTAADLR